MTDIEIENLLRKAPNPAAPAGLKERLQEDIVLPQRHAAAPKGNPFAVPWWRRWLPAVSFATVFLTCIVLLAMQTSQLIQLRRDNEALRDATKTLAQLRRENQDLQQRQAQAQELDRLRKDSLERQRLRTEIDQLRGQLQAFAQLRAENQRLLAEQAARRKQAPAEADPFAEARANAMRISCINNLKQIGLAARLWTNDNKDQLPEDFQSMTNELGTPKILVCPADANRKPSANWAEFTPQNVSYEMLSPGIGDKDPEVVYARCPIHNSVTTVDGAVQYLGTARQVIEVDGKKKISNFPPPSDQPASER